MRLHTHWLPCAVALLAGAAAAPAQEPPAPAPRRDPVAAVAELADGPRERRERREPEEGERADEFETDRDSFTPASSVVGRRRAVLETAYSFIDNRRSPETHSVPELLVRYGLTERVELRFGFNYEVGGGNEVSGSGGGLNEPLARLEGLTRESVVSYGVKVRLTEQAGWLPRTALILQGTTPTGGSPGTSTATDLVAAVIAGWELPNRWRVDTALRYGTGSEGGDRFGRWAPSAVLRVPVGERWGVHGEYFGLFTTNREENGPQHFLSTGAHYQPTRNIELGFRVGVGLNDRSARFFTNVGVGLRY
jgi:hypothetical protein